MILLRGAGPERNLDANAPVAFTRRLLNSLAIRETDPSEVGVPLILEEKHEAMAVPKRIALTLPAGPDVEDSRWSSGPYRTASTTFGSAARCTGHFDDRRQFRQDRLASRAETFRIHVRQQTTPPLWHLYLMPDAGAEVAACRDSGATPTNLPCT